MKYCPKCMMEIETDEKLCDKCKTRLINLSDPEEILRFVKTVSAIINEATEEIKKHSETTYHIQHGELGKLCPVCFHTEAQVYKQLTRYFKK